MAKLILGIGTAHTPLVSEPARHWGDHGEADLRRTASLLAAHGGGNAEELLRRHGDRFQGDITPERFEERFQAAQDALAALRSTLNDRQPDVIVIVGDDQEDVFLFDYMPAMCVFSGGEIVNPPVDKPDGTPTWLAESLWGYRGSTTETYPCDPELATHLVRSLVSEGFDIAYVTDPPAGRHVGHAFTFVARRLLNGLARAPRLVPFMLNTYYPPNQPTATRCFALGGALRRAIQNWESDASVAILASGGLSHPIVDEDLDRAVLEAMHRSDAEALTLLDEAVFREGTSEIKNWITVAGAMAETTLRMELIDYIPGYRSLAGTGCGVAFARWQ